MVRGVKGSGDRGKSYKLEVPLVSSYESLKFMSFGVFPRSLTSSEVRNLSASIVHATSVYK